MYFFVLCVVGFESFLCSCDVGRIRLVLSVDRASPRLLCIRWRYPLFRLASIAFAFNMYTHVRPVDVVCFSRIGV